MNSGYPMKIFYPEVEGNLVHRLVMAAFIGPCPEGYEVMHKDDNRANARLDNLCYGTHQENVQDTITKGRQTRRYLTDIQVREIRKTLTALRKSTGARRVPCGACNTLAIKYGVSERCIEAIWWGKNYKNA